MADKSFDKNNLLVVLDPPASQASANTTWVQPFADSKGADRAVFFLLVGDVASNTVTMKLTQATSSGGAGAKDITGATLVAITTATTGEIASIEIGPGAMDDAGGFTWVRAEVTVAGGGSEVYSVLYDRHNLRRPGAWSQDTTYSQQVRVYD